MREGSALRRAVVKGAGRRGRASGGHADESRKGPKRDLQQHLQQLFHHYRPDEKEKE